MTESEGPKHSPGTPGGPHDNGAATPGKHQPGAGQGPSRSQAQTQSQTQSPSTTGSSPAQSQASGGQVQTQGPATLPLPEPRPDAVHLVAPAADGYDEMLVAETEVRAAYAPYAQWLAETSGDSLQRKRDEADRRNVVVHRTVEGALFLERLADTIVDKARELPR